eukprot:6918018-Alexandrium_andersonii.AAC.1
MSASLVGSEMCIRDRCSCEPQAAAMVQPPSGLDGHTTHTHTFIAMQESLRFARTKGNISA